MIVKSPNAAFLLGMLTSALLVVGLAAAAQEGAPEQRYDAAGVMGGLGLQIIDHESNKLYNYKREESDNRVEYRLKETVDLSRAGEKTLPVKLIKGQ